MLEQLHRCRSICCFTTAPQVCSSTAANREANVPCACCRYNLVVIGAGSGGLVTAAGSAGVGARVALIEDHLMGGDCLNYGCVPSKALIRCARAAHEARL